MDRKSLKIAVLMAAAWMPQACSQDVSSDIVDGSERNSSKSVQINEESGLKPNQIASLVSSSRPSLRQCRMDGCSWSINYKTYDMTQNLSIDGKRYVIDLKVEETLKGHSLHKNGNYPQLHSKNINIKWDKWPLIKYYICRKSSPAIIFQKKEDEKEFKFSSIYIRFRDAASSNADSISDFLRVCERVKISSDEVILNDKNFVALYVGLGYDSNSFWSMTDQQDHLSLNDAIEKYFQAVKSKL